MSKRFKTLSKARSITLPADICRELGIAAKDGMDLEVQEDGRIVIGKHTPTCIFCGSYASIKHAGRDICQACAGQISKGV